ncbi:hypothetical protein GQ457_03G004320 [Hibiscus cannabinus]
MLRSNRSDNSHLLNSLFSCSSSWPNTAKTRNFALQVLTKLYPFAGRLVKDRNAIDCNDQGVEYLEARVCNAEMNQFIMDEIEAKSVNRLTPFPNELEFTTNILAVQVNKFNCGGLAIGLGLSRTQILIALIGKVRIALAETKNGSSRDSLQFFPINFRGRTGLPIPINAAGNLFVNVTVRCKRPGERNPKRHGSLCESRNGRGLLLSARESSRVIHGELVKGETDICLLTSWCRFPYYEADFGWGKPVWIASAHKATEMVLLLDTAGSDDVGIEAWVTLEPDNMARFEQDPDILLWFQAF